MIKPGDMGVTLFTAAPAVSAPCPNCPFVMAEKGEGYIEPERLEAILFSVTIGQPFYCHKTVYTPKTKYETTPEDFEAARWSGTWKMCAGALEAARKLAAEHDIIVKEY